MFVVICSTFVMILSIMTYTAVHIGADPGFEFRRYEKSKCAPKAREILLHRPLFTLYTRNRLLYPNCARNAGIRTESERL